MAPLTIYRDSDMNSTAVSNLFIDEYMGGANDAQLKVYLYLLRMMNAQLATSVSDIADKFNHTEKDVVRALKYWEKQDLLDLNYDEDKNLVGIHIKDLSMEKAVGRRSRPAATFVPMPTVSSAEQSHDRGCSGMLTAMHTETPSETVPAEVPSMAGSASKSRASLPLTDTDTASRYEKPVYSADQLREFRNRQDTAQLLFIAESYIGKPLTPSEVKSILFFTDTLHFSEDLIDHLLQYCVERGKKSFRYIEKVAISWAEEGITTPEQAQAVSAGYDKRVYSIMKALGKNSVPTDTELSFINRWTMDYAFSSDIIFEACQRTVLNTDKNRFQYADRMLSMWKEQNVQSTADIIRLDEAYHRNKKNNGRVSDADGASHKPINRFNQFTQNTYDFEALEKKLLSN
ncbi:MAG: DnaD domain protein [Acetatifactor sp.]|nr:DnaD domain protein [Acetatifactor sp.]